VTASSEVAYTLNKRWSSIGELMEAYDAGGLRLDLGCGYVKPPGFIGLDNLVGERTQIRNEQNAPDVLIDLNAQPLPFPDDSCVEVRSSHFLEHSLLDHVLDESYRVLKAGGMFRFTVPYANSAEGMYPGHSVFLTEKWFHKNPNFQQKFEILRETYDPSEAWLALPRGVRWLVPFDLARTFLFNVCWQMTIEARVKK
jgi:predicted SAM-dependent methyltransferase